MCGTRQELLQCSNPDTAQIAPDGSGCGGKMDCVLTSSPIFRKASYAAARAPSTSRWKGLERSLPHGRAKRDLRLKRGVERWRDQAVPGCLQGPQACGTCSCQSLRRRSSWRGSPGPSYRFRPPAPWLLSAAHLAQFSKPSSPVLQYITPQTLLLPYCAKLLALSS